MLPSPLQGGLDNVVSMFLYIAKECFGLATADVKVGQLRELGSDTRVPANCSCVVRSCACLPCRHTSLLRRPWLVSQPTLTPHYPRSHPRSPAR